MGPAVVDAYLKNYCWCLFKELLW